MKQLIASIIIIQMSIEMNAQLPLYQSPAFTVYTDKVVQGKYTARALSSTRIVSNYESPVNLLQPATISFKFAINGRDNEMPAGQDHHFTILPVNGYAETPLIAFGKQLNKVSEKNISLPPNTRLKIRLDMRDMLQQFNQHGYYACFNGTKIYKQDFKAVYIAGGTLPMSWDFDNLFNKKGLQLQDPDGDGIYETELTLNVSQDQKKIATEWIQTKDASAFPQFHTDHLLTNAIYNMSLEEMIKAVEPDSTFRTGKEWAGVWTRDISYSIILSMAYLQPKVAMNSLLKKVNKKKRIIQDTGTGGAYPASTDRMIWATAAWEVYKATGDRDWLALVFEIIKNSISDDQHNAYDATTGLVRGESSFLDWREQTYPKWMQPADIYESECLGTNAAHYQANVVLSKMAMVLNQPEIAQKHAVLAQKIKDGINQYLWMPEKGYYAQYLYGRNYKMISPRSEALGEALCILFGIADEKKAAQIVASVPITDFGISCIYPQIPNIPPYHNNAVWPFVQSYWAMAAAKVGNEKSVLESICSIYRPAALFLTNKENFVADNGDFAGTQINSSNMLWSLSGNLAIVHKLLFGIEFLEDRMLFHPFVPAGFKGKQELSNFKYRGAVLNIALEGYGNKIRQFFLDDQLQAKAELPETINGIHRIRIVLNNSLLEGVQINRVKNYTSVAAPILELREGKLSWQKVPGATNYQIYRNGKLMSSTRNLSYLASAGNFAEYQVIATDKNGIPSFASEPQMVVDDKLVFNYEAENYYSKSDLNYQGYSGSGFLETSKEKNSMLTFPIDVEKAGWYAIDLKYANGNGPTNTENKCAIRTLKVNNEVAGTLILPQRGKNEWSNWGYSNAVQVQLNKGPQSISISLEDYNDNMNGEINQAMIDRIRLIFLK